VATKNIIVTSADGVRGYTYRAHLSPTGRLKRITAGCRVWASFAEALDHYEHHPDWRIRLMQGVPIYRHQPENYWPHCKESAIAALGRLAKSVKRRRAKLLAASAS